MNETGLFISGEVRRRRGPRSCVAFASSATTRTNGIASWRKLSLVPHTQRGRGGAAVGVPLNQMFRTAVALEDHIGDTAAHPGDRMEPLSRSRDEAVFFVDPFRFDITRNPNPHLAFGLFGPHAPVSRSLGSNSLEALVEMARRFMQPARADEVSFHRAGRVRRRCAAIRPRCSMPPTGVGGRDRAHGVTAPAVHQLAALQRSRRMGADRPPAALALRTVPVRHGLSRSVR